MEILTDQMVTEQGRIWQTETGMDDLSRECFEAGLKWARDKKFLNPYLWTEKETYTTVLVNALRMRDERMSSLVKDPVDRGASIPHGG